jgi:hypothetical protein
MYNDLYTLQFSYKSMETSYSFKDTYTYFGLEHHSQHNICLLVGLKADQITP